MLVLILFLVVGSALVYISKYNFLPVSLNLGFLVISDLPLFYVIVGSILVGLILAYILYLVNAISTAVALHGKDKEIKKEKAEVLELTKRIHQLELENEKIKREPVIEVEDPNSL